MDWREMWEEKDAQGDVVLNVWMDGTAAIAYKYETPSGVQGFIETVSNLIPKKKPPTYRPYNVEEIPYGKAIKDSVGNVALIWGYNAHTKNVRAGADVAIALKQLCDNYTHLDGTPAGVAE